MNILGIDTIVFGLNIHNYYQEMRTTINYYKLLKEKSQNQEEKEQLLKNTLN